MQESRVANEKPPFPPVVYKYRDWQNEYHRNLLLKNQLYLASPKDFNDPFDCRIPMNLHLLDTKEKRIAYVDDLMIRHFDDMVNRNDNIEVRLKEITDRVENKLDEEQARLEAWQSKLQDAHYGIISFSCVWNNLLMWAHYAASHTGFCVGFHENRMQGFLRFGSGGKVSYSENFPEISPLRKKGNEEQEIMTRAFAETYTKANDWKYEEEYRILKLLFPEEFTSVDRFVEFPDDFYTEIIVGLNFPEEQLISISDIAQQKKIPLYKCVKVPFKFKLERKQIL